MLNRSSILTLAAIAAIGTTALTSTSASAMRPVGGPTHTATGGAGGGAVHLNPGLSRVVPTGAGGGGSGKLVFHNPALINRINPSLPPAISLKKPINIDCVTFKNCDHDHDHDHDHDYDHDHDHHYRWFADWHRPHYGVVEYDTISAPVGTSRIAAPCNCLTKSYLDDGSVLFSDVCTKEQAMATPEELRAQAVVR